MTTLRYEGDEQSSVILLPTNPIYKKLLRVLPNEALGEYEIISVDNNIYTKIKEALKYMRMNGYSFMVYFPNENYWLVVPKPLINRKPNSLLIESITFNIQNKEFTILPNYFVEFGNSLEPDLFQIISSNEERFIVNSYWTIYQSYIGNSWQASTMFFFIDSLRQMTHGNVTISKTLEQIKEFLGSFKKQQKDRRNNTPSNVLDGKDKAEFLTPDSAYMKELVGLAEKLVASIFDMPITKLTGEQAKGLGNSDKGSLENWDAQILAIQTNIITPVLNQMKKVELPSFSFVLKSVLDLEKEEKIAKILVDYSKIDFISDRNKKILTNRLLNIKEEE